MWKEVVTGGKCLSDNNKDFHAAWTALEILCRDIYRDEGEEIERVGLQRQGLTNKFA